MIASETQNTPVTIDVFATETHLTSIISQFDKDIFKNTADFTALKNSDCFSSVNVFTNRVDYSPNAMLEIHVKMK